MSYLVNKRYLKGEMSILNKKNLQGMLHLIMSIDIEYKIDLLQRILSKSKFL